MAENARELRSRSALDSGPLREAGECRRLARSRIPLRIGSEVAARNHRLLQASRFASSADEAT